MTATHSTIPVVKAQLVTRLTTALATASSAGGQVQTSYAWPGASTEPESVFLGPHPAIEQTNIEASEVDPAVKAGRRMRQEEYQVPITVWVYSPHLTPVDAATCESRAFTIAGLIEDSIADDPLIGLTVASGVQSALIAGISSALHPFESGWACQLTIAVSVRARLQ